MNTSVELHKVDSRRAVIMYIRKGKPKGANKNPPLPTAKNNYLFLKAFITKKVLTYICAKHIKSKYGSILQKPQF